MKVTANQSKPEIKITKFNGNNFKMFKTDIEQAIKRMQRTKYILNSLPSNATELESTEDSQIQAIIANNCIKVIKEQIQFRCTTYEMWKYLNDEYGTVHCTIILSMDKKSSIHGNKTIFRI